MNRFPFNLGFINRFLSPNIPRAMLMLCCARFIVLTQLASMRSTFKQFGRLVGRSVCGEHNDFQFCVNNLLDYNWIDAFSCTQQQQQQQQRHWWPNNVVN